MTESMKPRYIPWSEEEFQADIHVRGMTPKQRWIYRSLLQSCFFISTRPRLPIDDDQLWILAGCENLKEWDENKPVVLKRFTQVERDGEKLLENKRVIKDWDKLLEERQHWIDMGRKSASVQRTFNGGSTQAEPRFNGGSTQAEPRFNGGSTQAEQDKISKQSTGTSCFSTPSSRSENKFSEAENFSRPEEGKVLSTEYLPGFNLTLDQLTDDLQIAPSRDFEKWLSGEMGRAKAPYRKKESLGLHKTNRDKIERLRCEDERALLGAWRLFLYSDSYKDKASKARYLVSYFLNGMDQWYEKFAEFTGEARPRHNEFPEEPRRPSQVLSNEPKVAVDLVPQQGGSLQKETMAERRVRELEEDDIENALKNIETLERGT